MIARLPALFLCGALLPAAAQEIGVGGGATRVHDPDDSSYGWFFSYKHPLTGHWSAMFTYRNEGHIPSHHRDGHAVQLWYSTNDGDGFALRAGVGPYRYFDTEVAESPTGFRNAHGWGALYSLAATWKPAGRWTWQMRADRIQARDSFDSTQLMLGASYRLSADPLHAADGASWAAGARRYELDVMAGKTILNSFESENATAHLVELRAALTPAIRVTIGALDEGHAGLLDRNGLVMQLWLEPSFSSERFTIGVGAGPYFGSDRERSATHVHALVGTTFSWRFAGAWTARITWNRVASNYDRDSDIITAGVGYRF